MTLIWGALERCCSEGKCFPALMFHNAYECQRGSTERSRDTCQEKQGASYGEPGSEEESKRDLQSPQLGLYTGWDWGNRARAKCYGAVPRVAIPSNQQQ